VTTAISVMIEVCSCRLVTSGSCNSDLQILSNQAYLMSRVTTTLRGLSFLGLVALHDKPLLLYGIFTGHHPTQFLARDSIRPYPEPQKVSRKWVSFLASWHHIILAFSVVK